MRCCCRGDAWSEEATDLLEELTHVALWKPLTAKIHSYKDRPTRAKREGSPVPCVDLYDTTGPNELDIAHELVNRGMFLIYALVSRLIGSSFLAPLLARIIRRESDDACLF